MEDIR